MKKLLPVLLLLIGSGAGVGAGVFLRSEPEPQAKKEVVEKKEEEKPKKDEDTSGLPIDGKEYIKLSNQFVVPLVKDERITSMVVMTLSVEVAEGQGQQVYDVEPKIRDAFLSVLFDHAAIGGFEGAFLTVDNLDMVRNSLRAVAHKTFGSDLISDVLIFEIARQDY